VCIFAKKDQYFNNIDISHLFKVQDLEICAIQLAIKSANLIILSMYRAASGDINEFLKRLDAILKYLYSPISEFIICGDINVNCLKENNHKQQINSLLKSYTLSHTVNFATRVQNSSSTAIDNIFIDSARLSSSSTSPIVSGLSDHNAQFLTISNIAEEVNLAPSKWRTRIINGETTAQFQCLLENETWEPVFENRDSNYKFNSFLFMFLKIFEASFPIQNRSVGKSKTTGLHTQKKTVILTPFYLHF
jgi:hypothetical protein